VSRKVAVQNEAQGYDPDWVHARRVFALMRGRDEPVGRLEDWRQSAAFQTSERRSQRLPPPPEEGFRQGQNPAQHARLLYVALSCLPPSVQAARKGHTETIAPRATSPRQRPGGVSVVIFLAWRAQLALASATKRSKQIRKQSQRLARS